MNYVYHRVPPDMVGNVLYPMNQLQTINKELHKRYRDGYDGREQLLARTIPMLNCLWNDVLHCSPIHPRTLVAALGAAGITDIPKQEYYQIDVDADLDITNSVIFYRDSNEPGDVRFQAAKDADWSRITTIPQLTLDHYKEAAAGKEALFAFHGIPHFLYKGTIDTSNLYRISV